jgi:hypothetical protein
VLQVLFNICLSARISSHDWDSSSGWALFLRERYPVPSTSRTSFKPSPFASHINVMQLFGFFLYLLHYLMTKLIEFESLILIRDAPDIRPDNPAFFDIRLIQWFISFSSNKGRKKICFKINLVTRSCFV